MIFILNTFITDKRERGNRYPRIDVFKYSLYSYRNLPFKEIYIFIGLDDNYKDEKDNLSRLIYKFFKIDKSKIHVEFVRYTKQEQWKPYLISPRATALPSKTFDLVVLFLVIGLGQQ